MIEEGMLADLLKDFEKLGGESSGEFLSVAGRQPGRVSACEVCGGPAPEGRPRKFGDEVVVR